MKVVGGNTNFSSSGRLADRSRGASRTATIFAHSWAVTTPATPNSYHMCDHSAADWPDSLGITLNNLTTTGGMSESCHRPTDGSAGRRACPA